MAAGPCLRAPLRQPASLSAVVPALLLKRSWLKEASAPLEHLLVFVLPTVISSCALMGIFVVAVSSLKAFWQYCRGLSTRRPGNIKFDLANGLPFAWNSKMAAGLLKTVLVRDLSELLVLGAIILCGPCCPF